jgi:N4-gp56 family major capsid protein
MAQKIPKNSGRLVRWTRYEKLEPSLAPLIEGTNPAEVSLDTFQVEATVDQYGEFAKVSDLLKFTAIDPVIENLAERFGRGAADLIEQLIIAELDAEAFEQFAGNQSDFDSITQADVMSHEEIIAAITAQELDFIRPHESGRTQVVLNTVSKRDLQSDPAVGSWVDLNKYTGGSDAQRKLLSGTFGEMYGAALRISDRMSNATNTGTIKVYNNYCIGEEAFGVVDLASGRPIEMVLKDERSGGVSNPLNMFGTVGYKVKGYATKYLDSGSKRVVNIRAASVVDA